MPAFMLQYCTWYIVQHWSTTVIFAVPNSFSGSCSTHLLYSFCQQLQLQSFLVAIFDGECQCWEVCHSVELVIVSTYNQLRWAIVELFEKWAGSMALSSIARFGFRLGINREIARGSVQSPFTGHRVCIDWSSTLVAINSHLSSWLTHNYFDESNGTKSCWWFFRRRYYRQSGEHWMFSRAGDILYHIIPAWCFVKCALVRLQPMFMLYKSNPWYIELRGRPILCMTKCIESYFFSFCPQDSRLGSERFLIRRSRLNMVTLFHWHPSSHGISRCGTTQRHWKWISPIWRFDLDVPFALLRTRHGKQNQGCVQYFTGCHRMSTVHSHNHSPTASRRP